MPRGHTTGAASRTGSAKHSKARRADTDAPLSAAPTLRLFLSYARADDAITAITADLHAFLEAEGFDVWLDRVNMPGRGLTFLQEIRDVIDACDRLVVLIGPNAVSSDYVRAEWQYALAIGKVVNPILVAGGLDLLPPELKNLDCPDASRRARRRHALRHLARHLREPVRELGPLLGIVPDVPAHYQPRTDEVSQLADCALIDTRHPVVTHVEQRITIVYGMPGAGKSAIAAAFARSPEVRRAFANGIVWVRGGKDLGAKQAVLAVCAAIGVPASPRDSIDDIAGPLRQALTYNLYLVVLDDVWSLDAVQVFRDLLGPRSRLMATTRQAEFQSSLGCLGMAVGSLSEEASLRQLADWTGVPAESLPPDARAVARECGYLPFALALCGAMVRDGLRFADLLVQLQSARLTFLDRRIGDYPYRNFLRAMAASVDTFRRENRKAVDRYLELVVFAPGSRIPVSAIVLLWSAGGLIRAAEVRDALARLQGRSLLRLGHDDTVELHDLQWDYLAATTKSSRPLHKRLLARYARTYPQGVHTAPPGDYIVEHLARHLDAAGDMDALVRRIDRQWFERKFAGDALRESFLRDIDCAMRRVLALRRQPLGTLARLALVRSSAADIGVKVPPSALYVLARCGDTALALDAARQAGHEWSQAQYYSSVAAGLRDRGDIAAAQRIARVVVDLAPDVPVQRTPFLSWAAQLFAETGDSNADRSIDRAFAACEEDAPQMAVTEPMVQTALAASRLGRRADATRMLVAAEKQAATRDPHDESLAAVAGGWLQAGDTRRALRLVDARIAERRRDRVARSWSPVVRLAGEVALACIEAGREQDAIRVWARCRARDRRDRDWLWYAAIIAARRGRAAEASRWARSTGAGLERTERRMEVASLLADCGSELAKSGQRRHAIRFADRALALLHASRYTPSTGSVRHAMIGEDQHRARTADLLCGIAQALADSGDDSRAGHMARQALLLSAQFEWDLRHVGNAEAAIAIVHGRKGRVAAAIGVANAIADDYARNEAREMLVPVFATSGRVDEMLRAARAIDSSGYARWQRSRVLADHAIPALPQRLVARAAPRILRVTTDISARCRALAGLARRLPDEYLAPAVEAWIESADADQEGVAMLAITLAARGRREEGSIRRQLEPRLFRVPDSYSRIRWCESLARVLVVLGERDKANAALTATDRGDVEYDAASASRIALVFLESGWIAEGKRAADAASARLARFGGGYPLGEGDVNARLALVWHRLGQPLRSLRHVRRALEVLSGNSSSQSAFDPPDVMRKAIGVSLAEIESPEGAVRVIRDVVGIEPDDAANTLCGLFSAVLERRGTAVARDLEAALDASGTGCGSWLRARLAAQWHAAGQLRRALERFVESVERSSRQSPGIALDVLGTGAPIIDAVDAGRTLSAIYSSMREIQTWGGGTVSHQRSASKPRKP